MAYQDWQDNLSRFVGQRTTENCQASYRRSRKNPTRESVILRCHSVLFSSNLERGLTLTLLKLTRRGCGLLEQRLGDGWSRAAETDGFYPL